MCEHSLCSSNQLKLALSWRWRRSTWSHLASRFFLLICWFVCLPWCILCFGVTDEEVVEICFSCSHWLGQAHPSPTPEILHSSHNLIIPSVKIDDTLPKLIKPKGSITFFLYYFRKLFIFAFDFSINWFKPGRSVPLAPNACFNSSILKRANKSATCTF